MTAAILPLIDAIVSARCGKANTRRNFASDVRSRRIAMYIARKVGRISFTQIGKFYRRHHSAVIASVRKIDLLRDQDQEMNALLGEIEAVVLKCKQQHSDQTRNTWLNDIDESYWMRYWRDKKLSREMQELQKKAQVADHYKERYEKLAASHSSVVSSIHKEVDIRNESSLLDCVKRLRAIQYILKSCEAR